MVIDKRIRAYFTCHVVMPDNMVRRDAVLSHQFFCQGNRCLHCRVLKVPVTAGVCLAPLIPHAKFDSNTVCVPALRVLVRLRATMPGNILILYRLPYLSLKAHKVVGAGPDAAAGIVSTVGLCPAGGADIVDYDVLNTTDITAVIVIRC